MQATITSDAFPVVEFQLQPGEQLLSEPGELSWMSANVRMRTSTNAAGSNGLMGAFARALGGGGLFLTEYYTESAIGSVAFAAKVPGKILPIRVNPQLAYIIHRHGFLCGTGGITLTATLQKSFGAGLFGGNGFVMQRLSGSGEAWVELGGHVVERQLLAGETLLVHPGHVGMYEESINFGWRTISGIRNIFFGGNGIFLAELTGPGKVWLQTLTLPNLAHALSPYLDANAQSNGATEGAAIGIVGALARGLFK